MTGSGFHHPREEPGRARTDVRDGGERDQRFGELEGKDSSVQEETDEEHDGKRERNTNPFCRRPIQR